MKFEFDLTKMSDEQLARELEWIQDHNKETEIILDKGRRTEDRYKSEMHKRQMAAFWQSNPNLYPLKVGDELTLTKEVAVKHGDMSQVGELLMVHKLAIYDDGVISVDLGTKAKVSYEDVVTMRRAYLERESNQIR